MHAIQLTYIFKKDIPVYKECNGFYKTFKYKLGRRVLVLKEGSSILAHAWVNIHVYVH